MVPPAYMTGSQNGGTCISTEHFEGAVCASNERACSSLPSSQIDGREVYFSSTWSTCRARSQADCASNNTYQSGSNSCTPSVNNYSSCAEIKRLGANTDGLYTISIAGSPTEVYCELSGTDAYMEIFNIDREPGLSDTEIANRMNRFTSIPLSPSQIVRDGSGRVAWRTATSDYSGISGSSYGMDKILVSGMKVSFKKRDDNGGEQGGFALHSSDQTGCNPNWNSSSPNCFSLAYKVSNNQIRFLLYDGGVGATNWPVIEYGNYTVYSNSLPLINDLILPDMPIHPYLTTFGRIEGSAYAQSFFVFSKIMVKDIEMQKPISCADAKAKGSLNLSNNTGSGYYILDHDGYNYGDPQDTVYCDMSGSGIATASKTCNEAKNYGQKSLSNDNASGLYNIDFDGSGAGSAVSNYCDMAGGAWDNFAGGYTLVGIFNSGLMSIAASSMDISSTYTYLNDSTYQTVLSNSSQILFRSNRQDNTEILFRTQKSDFSQLNCLSNATTLVPHLHEGSINVFVWQWRELSGCDGGGGDYSMFVSRNDVGPYFTTYSQAGSYSKYFNWSTGFFESLLTQSFNRSANDHTYIWLK